MRYSILFDDGSSAYLEHHGVKGMHWGIWNAETAARRAGRKAFRKQERERAKEWRYVHPGGSKSERKIAAFEGADPYKHTSSLDLRGQKKTVRAFNKTDKKKAVEIGKANQNAERASRYFSKAMKADFKGQSNKANRYFKKGEKYADAKTKHVNKAEQMDKRQRALLRDVERANPVLYKDKTRSIPREVKLSDVNRSTLSFGEKYVYGTLGNNALSKKQRGVVTGQKLTLGPNQNDPSKIQKFNKKTIDFDWNSPNKVRSAKGQIKKTTVRL